MSSPSSSSSSRHDALLLLASELGSGSWEVWKRSCAALRLEPNEAAHDQSALGHLEFDWRGSRFACAPTTLLPIPGLDGRLLLTGARPTGERERLQGLADEGGFDLAFAEPVPQRGGPASITCECEPEQAAAFAAEAEIAYEPLPELLAETLPTLTLELAGELRPPDLRFPHCPVDAQTLRPRWDMEALGIEDGLWLCYSQRRAEHYLRHAGAWWHLPIREHGPYLLESAASLEPPVFEYEQASWTVRTRSRAPLPPLQARALTLASGRLPLRRPLAGGEQEVAYPNVSPALAAAVSRSLALPLREPAPA